MAYAAVRPRSFSRGMREVRGACAKVAACRSARVAGCSRFRFAEILGALEGAVETAETDVPAFGNSESPVSNRFDQTYKHAPVIAACRPGRAEAASRRMRRGHPPSRFAGQVSGGFARQFPSGVARVRRGGLASPRMRLRPAAVTANVEAARRRARRLGSGVRQLALRAKYFLCVAALCCWRNLAQDAARVLRNSLVSATISYCRCVTPTIDRRVRRQMLQTCSARPPMPEGLHRCPQ